MKVARVNSLNMPSFENQLGFAGMDNWMNVVHEIYDYEVHRLVISEGDRPCGAASLLEVQHPVFGHYCVTAPFGSYGGFVFETDTVRDMLLNSASRLAEELKVQYINMRFEDGASPPPQGWIQLPSYYTYLIDLPHRPEDLLKTFSSDHRNHVRKSMKKGFQVRFGRLELLDDIYEALARSMHELGSPYHAKDYLKRMAQSLGDSLEFAVLYNSHGTITGGGVFIYQDGTISNLHANILRFVRSDYAGEFLYWSAIERGIQKEMQTFDLGRSLAGSGNEVFKMKWAPRRKLLAYWHWLAPGQKLPSLNQKNPRFQLAIETWRRLPAFVVRPLGPYLVRGLA